MSNLHDFQTLLSAYTQLLSDLQSTLNDYRQEAIRYQSLNQDDYGLIYLKLASLLWDKTAEIEDAIEATKQQIKELSVVIG